MPSPRIPSLLLLVACSLSASALAQAPAPASAAPPSTAVAPRAELFSLSDVRLLDGPFKQAMETDREYLLQLDADRLLAWFRKEAGLEPKAKNYPGWENQGLAGHSLGHYLSALAQMVQATGDVRLKERVDYIVNELALCQQANGNGYIGAMPDGKKMFAQIAAGDIRPKPGFNLNGGWVPWYNMHKLFAGLIDVTERTGSAKAREVLLKLADWCEGVVGRLDDAQMQNMLRVEQGGMAESLAEISVISGDEKYLALAEKFRHAAVFDPLAAGQDKLTGLHGNTQIPKIIGYERIHELTGDPAYGRVARNFWNFVVHDRSFANGGHGTNEHFFAIDKFRQNMLAAQGPETCNTYNMLKLTEHLFREQPSVEEVDYYERALYNQILASQMPGQPGALVYYTSMRPGAYRSFAEPEGSFWCCVGTGMENHARYGQMIYAHSREEKLYVNLFIPSEVKWGDATVRQETRFPLEGQTRVSFKLPAPRKFTVAVRYPKWAAAGGMKLKVNGVDQEGFNTYLEVSDGKIPEDKRLMDLLWQAKPGEFAKIEREWKDGDVLTVELPMQIRTEPLPHAEGIAAVFYGPILLAANLGADGMKDADFRRQIIDEKKVLPARDVPTFLDASAADLPAHLEPVSDAPLTFRTKDLAKPHEVTLQPFYTIGADRYALYWRMTTSGHYAEEVKAQEAAEKHQRELAARTIDSATPGEQQSEVDHNLKLEKATAGNFNDRRFREARNGGWFSYDLKTSGANGKSTHLLCTYWGGEGIPRNFDILLDGKLLSKQSLENNKPDEFFDVEYAIDPALTNGKERVTLRFQAPENGIAGGVFDVRLVQ